MSVPPAFCKSFLSLGGGTLDGDVDVADGCATGKVADGAADEKHGHAPKSCSFNDMLEGGLLREGESCLQQVDVISHEGWFAPSVRAVFFRPRLT